jgi:hypothetical protein
MRSNKKLFDSSMSRRELCISNSFDAEMYYFENKRSLSSSSMDMFIRVYKEELNPKPIPDDVLNLIKDHINSLSENKSYTIQNIASAVRSLAVSNEYSHLHILQKLTNSKLPVLSNDSIKSYVTDKYGVHTKFTNEYEKCFHSYRNSYIIDRQIEYSKLKRENTQPREPVSMPNFFLSDYCMRSSIYKFLEDKLVPNKPKQKMNNTSNVTITVFHDDAVPSSYSNNDGETKHLDNKENHSATNEIKNTDKSQDKLADNQKICIACNKSEITTLFYPCMHAVCCDSCSTIMNECRTCKVPIQNKSKIMLVS